MKKSGFTLVELSIVLVIIGLLIGGILVARSMVQTAKIQRLIKDLGQYEAAVNNFKTSYLKYPGDSPDFIPPGNGDNHFFRGGDGNSICADAPNSTLENMESEQVFAHLSQAQMLQEEYQSYAPASCGGTMNNSTNYMGGIIAPYTTLDTENAASVMTSKAPILGEEGVYGFAFSFVVDPYFVVPMESKMTSIPYVYGSADNVGLANPNGQGKCQSTDPFHIPPVKCDATNAALGLFVYYPNPI